jgi:D-hexose-6-phosphate mutarotase
MAWFQEADMSLPTPLPKISLTSPDADAEIYLNGAHVSRWQPKNQKDVLFLSKSSAFSAGKPIRGGVPVIFPWFGPREGQPQSPAHGFARSMSWNVVGCAQQSAGPCAMTLELISSPATRELWPYDFALRFTVSAARTLSMTLTVINTDAHPFTFEEALHTYLAVGDIRNVSITGLAGATYIDKTDGFARKPQGTEPIVITGETDRVYLATKSKCVVSDPVWNRKLIVEKQNSDATVVWNPWIAKAKAMPDFGDDEWPAMLCVETCNVADHKITLQPGQSHAMTAVVSVG